MVKYGVLRGGVHTGCVTVCYPWELRPCVQECTVFRTQCLALAKETMSLQGTMSLWAGSHWLRLRLSLKGIREFKLGV